MFNSICYKAECIKILCKILCMLMILIQSTIVVKILFCMVFYCSLMENHVFHGIKLLLNLFSLALNDADSQANAQKNFYIYVVCLNITGIFLYGIVSTSPSKKETTSLIDNLCFLGIVIFMCFINLLQNSAFLILIVFIGIDHDVAVQTEAAFLSTFEALQIITLSLLLTTFNVRYHEIKKEKSFLFTATLIHNIENEEPLLVR